MSEIAVGNLPFKEAIKFIQDKLLIPSKQWEDMIGPIHAKAFTVAGATKLQLLQDLYQAVQNSILDGTTITTFRKEFDAIVAKHGWSYKGKRGWRTNVIFQTNKRSAYMAGHWAKFQRLKEHRPYLMYMTVGDDRVRDEHKKWNRIVAHIDDPIWQQIFPPNGWLCRCFVRSLSKADLDEMGITAERLGKIEMVDYADPKTGEIIKKTPGVDLGWDYNVGKSWLAPEVLLGQQLMDIPPEMRAKALKWFDNDIYDKPFKTLVDRVALNLAKGGNTKIGESQAVGFLSEPIINVLIQKGSVPVGASLIARDKDIVWWLRDTKANRGATVPLSVAASLPEIVRNPDAILWDKADPKLIYVKKLTNGKYAKFILEVNTRSKLNVNKTRFNETLNTFKSAGVVQGNNLNIGRYEVIQGKIE